MKRFFLFLILHLIFCSVYAQTGDRITGVIIGKQSSAPIEYASVAVYSISPLKMITGTVTDSLGKFEIQDISYGKYEIKVNYVGCNDLISKPFAIDNNKKDINLGTLILDDTSLSLHEVMVTGKRSTYVQTVDKKIYNVGNDIAAGSGAISDLLSNVPSVQVDIDGGVSLRGNDNVLILINGKPSVLTKGANKGNVLQQIPAATIERIEVITNPSASFKPDGTSGIINLIMKKEAARGFNGNVLANVGNKNRYNAGVALEWNFAKFGINMNYSFRKDRRDRTNSNNRTLTDLSDYSHNYMTQYIESQAPSSSHIGGLELTWNPTKKNAFSLSGNVSYMTFPRSENNHTIQWNDIKTIKDYNRSRTDNENHKEAEGAFSYTHSFNNESTLTTDYTFAIQDEKEDNHYTNSYTNTSISDTYDNTIIKQKNISNLARIIYYTKINASNIINTGFEAQIDRSDLNYYAEDLINNNWIENSTMSNHFIFDQHIFSLYATWENSIGAFSWIAGIRGELSYIKSNLITLAETVTSHNIMAFPTMHTTYRLNDKNELQLNYSLRVNRPEGDDMNPFPEYKDPYNLKMGNPYLKPEKIHSLEFGWQYKYQYLTLIATPYYRYTFNKITNITEVLPGDVLKSTKENMSSSSAAGFELVINSAIGHWCNYNLSSNLFYNTIDASDLGYSNKKGSMAWYVSLNSDFNIGHHVMLQLNTRYNSSVITPQGKKGSTYIMNLGARYDIPRYGLTFTATVSDVLDSYKSVIYIDTPTIDQKIERRKMPRTFYIGISYRFGKNGDDKKDKKLKYDESL